MTQLGSHHSSYDLDERTFQFAKAVRMLVKTLPGNISCIEDCKQLVRSSGSVGANNREANEALSRKDFLMRIRISRKEAKESAYWLRLIGETHELAQIETVKSLVREAEELTKILSAIALKSI